LKPSAASRFGVHPSSEIREAIAARAKVSAASALSSSPTSSTSKALAGACGSRAEIE
jgi:hypothetical protein